MVTKGHLFIISGPSGAGKSTILSAILKKKPQLQYSISYTTRLPRGDEKDGVEYHFISEAVFRQKIEKGEFAEWAEVHGHLYGTSATRVDEVLAQGMDILFDIDVQGAKRLWAKYPEAISIFIAPPNMEVLEKRLLKRGVDSSAAMTQRLQNARAEMAQADDYDHVLINDDLTQTVSDLESIIEQASSVGSYEQLA
jgi:guanylate kinase